MISAQTLRVCREGKPLHTPHQVRGGLFPDHAPGGGIMRPDWREALRGCDRKNAVAGAVAGLGGAIAIGGMEWFSLSARYPLAAIPFATSIVLVIGGPETGPAQPRALIGGHFISTVVGLLVLSVTGQHAWAAALAVGLAILAMYLTDTFHPPAGINPLLVVSNNLDWTFLFVPVLAGALLLTLFAYGWHRWVHRLEWPLRWL
jgi:CBS-domain-containing membrane protein